MTAVPFYLRMLDDLTPTNIFDQDFGLGLLNSDLVQPRHTICLRPGRAGYIRPWSHGQSAVSNIVSNKDEFKVNLDVQQFKPEEVTVKIVNNYVVIDAKHEERQDEHGYISREFKRRYLLPDDVDLKAITSSLSSDGVLSVSVPKKQAASGTEVKIPIVQTHQPALKTDNKKKEVKDAGKGEKMDQ